MAERYEVTDNPVSLYVDGELSEETIEYVEVVSESGDSLKVDHIRPDGSSATVTSIDREDLEEAVGDWLAAA